MDGRSGNGASTVWSGDEWLPSRALERFIHPSSRLALRTLITSTLLA
jgi:hypothetical protein